MFSKKGTDKEGLTPKSGGYGTAPEKKPAEAAKPATGGFLSAAMGLVSPSGTAKERTSITAASTQGGYGAAPAAEAAPAKPSKGRPGSAFTLGNPFSGSTSPTYKGFGPGK
ncbi:MAG: hypothetical protein K0R66_759 [Gammaproteobacteria bacterium]|jgi:hypothetical protein|nr:hypothetical protein [Gammaproteobacteria bacterium]